MNEPPRHEQFRRELEHSARMMRATLARRRESTRLAFLCLSVVGMLGVALAVMLLVTGSGDSPVAPRAAGTPGPSIAGPGTPEPPAVHTVRHGETLARIALRYRAPIERITADNHLANPNRIAPGQRLVIRPAPPGVEVIAPGDTLTSHADRHGLTVAQLLSLNPHITHPDLIQAGGELRITAFPRAPTRF